MSFPDSETKRRGEDIAGYLSAHPPFAELITEGCLAFSFNESRNLKHSLQTRLDDMEARQAGVLVTVTPAGGQNTANGNKAVANTTNYLVQYWERLATRPDDSPLPAPLAMVDELQRALQGFVAPMPLPDTSARSDLERLKVGSWDEQADSAYLVYVIPCECLVELGKKATA